MTKSSKISDSEVQMDRRFKARRNENTVTAPDAEPVAEALVPRRKKQRRRQIDPTTCEREYKDEEILFMHALDAYKRSSGRMFPTCSEILEVIRGLGYFRLTEEEQTLLAAAGVSLAAATESSDADRELVESN